MKMDNKIISKVKKLLALAKDNPNDNEADTAMLMVQELLAKYNISMSDIDSSDDENEKNVIEESVTKFTRTPWWKKELAVIIAENFKCKTFLSVGQGKTKIVFLGLEMDVIIAKDVFQYAEIVIDRLAKSYVNKIYREGKSTKGVRNEFIWGFLKGLRDKFREQVEKNDWGLILVTDALVEKAFADKNLRKGSNSGIAPNFSGDLNARQEGYSEGQKFADTYERKGIEG
jgi:hypothetical protein